MNPALVRGRFLVSRILRGVVNERRWFAQTRHICRTLSSQPETPLIKEEKPTWDIRLLYDGDCPLCLREIDMLRRRDEGQGKISFVNIASEDYDPADHQSITYGKAMGVIHAILPTGEVIEGVEVFRRCYEAVGLGWVYALTKFKPIERFVSVAYNLWAKNRLRVTGRSDEGIEDLVLWSDQFSTCGDSESCEVPWDDEEEELHTTTKRNQ